MIPAMIIYTDKDLGGTYRKFDENNFQIARQGVHGLRTPCFREVIFFLAEITGDFMTHVIGNKPTLINDFAESNKIRIFET